MATKYYLLVLSLPQIKQSPNLILIDLQKDLIFQRHLSQQSLCNSDSCITKFQFMQVIDLISQAPNKTVKYQKFTYILQKYKEEHLISISQNESNAAILGEGLYSRGQEHEISSINNVLVSIQIPDLNNERTFDSMTELKAESMIDYEHQNLNEFSLKTNINGSNACIQIPIIFCSKSNFKPETLFSRIPSLLPHFNQIQQRIQSGWFKQKVTSKINDVFNCESRFFPVQSNSRKGQYESKGIKISERKGFVQRSIIKIPLLRWMFGQNFYNLLLRQRLRYQLLKYQGIGRNGENKQQFVAEIKRKLKAELKPLQVNKDLQVLISLPEKLVCIIREEKYHIIQIRMSY